MVAIDLPVAFLIFNMALVMPTKSAAGAKAIWSLCFLNERILKLAISPPLNVTDVEATGSVTESGLLLVPFIAEKINVVLKGLMSCAVDECIAARNIVAARKVFFICKKGDCLQC